MNHMGRQPSLTALKEVWNKRAPPSSGGPGQPGPTHWPYLYSHFLYLNSPTIAEHLPAAILQMVVTPVVGWMVLDGVGWLLDGQLVGRSLVGVCRI